MVLEMLDWLSLACKPSPISASLALGATATDVLEEELILRKLDALVSSFFQGYRLDRVEAERLIESPSVGSTGLATALLPCTWSSTVRFLRKLLRLPWLPLLGNTMPTSSNSSSCKAVAEAK
jgi:hypothetical protein